MREAPPYDSPMPPPRKGRVLFFAYYYPPLGGAGSNRALSFARELPRLGWEVEIVTPLDGVYGKDSSLDGDGLPGVRVHRTGTFELPVLYRRFRRGLGSGAAQSASGSYVEEAPVGPISGTLRAVARRLLYFPDSCKGWVRHALKTARAAHRREPFDVVLSSSPPISSHVAAREFAADAGVPWVADWRDFWSADSRSGGLLGGRAVAFEKRLMRDASGLTGATAGVTRIMARLLQDPDRAVTVRNGFDPADFAGPAPAVTPGSLVYTGTLYGKSEQDPEDLFLALKDVRESGRLPTDFRVRFLGKAEPYSVALAASMGLDGLVTFEGFREHAECVRAMRSASMLLLLGSLRTSEAGLASVPAKTYEYLAAGRPILALGLPGSEMQTVLAGLPGVRFLGYRERDAIRDAILGNLAGTEPGDASSNSRALSFARSEAVRELDALLSRVRASTGR